LEDEKTDGKEELKAERSKLKKTVSLVLFVILVPVK
jgi:hypothetical protein